ncbi:acyltransferase [Parabacteroides chinchillae]|uniref:Acetyltransferase n=1 Tax=Parabacteroides chinchillae TaxID=871327 RepID=A0A8G2F1C4_9BACT|nr:DapH/DapD/GlmU-related protein [Parabacteroides chinchillae]SEF84936.1 transferase hexapeptide (six repeat-containing protein) [Parabacteroides chinchillae]
MKQLLKNISEPVLRILIHWAYPRFERQEGYTSYAHIFIHFFLMQKIVGINRSVPWPVHFTSQVIEWQKIEKGICCDPGDCKGVYINAHGGLKIGNNVEIAPNTVISTVNHHKRDFRKIGYKKGITIGNNVWIGANCSILAGVTIGDNVVIGAGCTIREDVPSDTVVSQTAESLVYKPQSGPHEWDYTTARLM